MQREFNLELLANKKAVVNCKTKKEEQEFLNFLDSKNMRWVTDSEIFNPTSYKYDEFKEKTCFKIDRNNELSFDEIKEFKDYTILLLDDIVVGKKLNNFEEYGFTADFEGEILKEVKNYYIGWAIVKDYGLASCKWSKNGVTNYKVYDLTPIKKEWYENPYNFGKIISINETLGIFNRYKKENETIIYTSLINNLEYTIHINKCRPATQEEILTLLIKEQ